MADVTVRIASSDAAPATASQRHRKNLLALSGSQLITWSLVLVWTFIVPRRLGPASWGILVTASALAGLLGVLMGYGMRSYYVREMVRAPQNTGRLIATALVTRLLVFVPGLLLMAVFLELFRFTSQQRFVIFLGTGVVYLAMLAEPLQAVFQATQHMEYLAASTTTDKVGQAVGAIILVLLGFGVVAVSVWWFLSTAIVLALALLWVRPFAHLSLRTDLGEMKAMLVDSFPFWTMGLFLTFYVWIDTAMLSVMQPEHVVGWYGVPTRLFGTLLFAATIISTAWLPRFVIAHEQGADQLRSVARRPGEQLLILGIPIAFGSAVVAGPVIRLLYGPAYDGAIPVMVILALCVLPLYINILANQLLVASGRQSVWTRVMIAASVVNPLLNLAAIPLTATLFHNGAIGSAASLLITELFIAVFSFTRILRGVLDAHSMRRVLRAFIAGLLMAALVYLLRGIGLAVEIAIGAISFGVLALVLRVPTEEDRRTVFATLQRLRSRWR